MSSIAVSAYHELLRSQATSSPAPFVHVSSKASWNGAI
jgi:hypothetical protein